MTMAELRDLLGTTRKYAVPIGEYLDRIGLTRREGDVRPPRRPARDRPSDGRSSRRRPTRERPRPSAACRRSTRSWTRPGLAERSGRRGARGDRPGRPRGARRGPRGARRAGREPAVDVESLARRAGGRSAADRPWLRPVINATGILLHTGLGRAPLAAEAVEAVDRVVRGYCNLEFDLDTRRARAADRRASTALLRRLTGAEAATVVNNNAGATVLALRALAAGREVIVSRGQLVEIGGSFRLPEIFEVSGARLREVGTTNKTRLSDYERAIGPETAALLRVHPSNYRIVGFTEAVAIADLAALARARGLWAIDDIGSGALGPGLPAAASRTSRRSPRGSPPAPTSCSFSGDKLLGGPQCGHPGRHARGDRPGRGRPADAGPPGRQDDAGRPRGDPAAGPRPRPRRPIASRSGRS